MNVPPSNKSWLYAVACVTVPMLWGLIVVAVSNRLERRFFRPSRTDPSSGRSEPPPLEYHI
jgi:hypothetical protein